MRMLPFTLPEIDSLAPPLSHLDTDLAQVGGKALNLGRLLQAGFPVPEGFCLTTRAYRAAIAHPQVAETLAVLESLEPGPIREAILAAPVPPEVEQAIRVAYAQLGDDVPVAVRSSATAEDLPEASFAGQQDTYLNVIGGDEVVAAVRRCWASLWTDRAFSYRKEARIEHRDVSLAVVVQRMVQARTAGVMFTADPLTGNRRHIVIDAAPGLGEAVVAGAVNPDHFVLAAGDTGQIWKPIRESLGDKRFAIRPQPGGGTRKVDSGKADSGKADSGKADSGKADSGKADNHSNERACLEPAELALLAALGTRVQALFGVPQDIEWAIDDQGEPWLTQARPITTLYPLPDALPDQLPDDLRVYYCASASWQGLTRPVTPMGLSALALATSSISRLFGVPVADPARGPNAFVVAGMRMYLDLTHAMRTGSGRKFLPLGLALADSRSLAVLHRLFDDPRFAVTDPRRGPFLRRLVRAGLRYGVPLRIIEALIAPGAARRRIDRFGETLSRRTRVPCPASPSQRLDAAEKMILDSVASVWARIIPITGVGMAMLGITRKLAGPAADDKAMQGVLRGLPDNVTTEMDLALWRLALSIGTDPVAAQYFRAATPDELTRLYLEGALPGTAGPEVATFLRAYGHRAVAESDLGIARWAEDPTHIFSTLSSYLALDDPQRAPDAQFERAAAQARTEIAELVRAASARAWWRGRLVAFALKRARRLLGLREQAKFYNIFVLAQAREQIRMVGRWLAERGQLATAEDVFLLYLPQVRAAVAGASVLDVVEANRRGYQRELRRKRIPQLMLSDGSDPEAESPVAVAAEGVLAGTPVSLGTATGRVRVVLDPVGVRLEPGEILVAPSTDPGWTPLFLTAGALVMETGGVNSHGAVVAREYGIPAVVGVPEATTALHTGQCVTVDGMAGTVTKETVTKETVTTI